MFRAVAISGASAITIELALLAPFDLAFAQTHSLPPVTIEAPKVAATRVVRKPGQRSAALTRRTPKLVAVPPPARPVVVVINTDSGGVNASYGTPPVVARFQLPQESYSITSKMPDKPFAVAKETVSVMPWDQYGTKDTYVTSQTSAAAGNRNGALSWLISANYLDSYQQPLTYTTNATPPANTAGTFIALNKQGLPADVVGTAALAHSPQT